jgi:hypothetical protein
MNHHPEAFDLLGRKRFEDIHQSQQTSLLRCRQSSVHNRTLARSDRKSGGVRHTYAASAPRPFSRCGSYWKGRSS